MNRIFVCRKEISIAESTTVILDGLEMDEVILAVETMCQELARQIVGLEHLKKEGCTCFGVHLTKRLDNLILAKNKFIYLRDE